MTNLTQTTMTENDFEYLVDDFDTANAGNDLGAVAIAGMVLLSHAYIDRAGNIPEKSKEGFKINFPYLKKCEWYYLANAFRHYYLGRDMNATSYKVMLNKYKATYTDWKDLDNKFCK